jgi:hypothetical protein
VENDGNRVVCGKIRSEGREKPPRVSGMSHASLARRDLSESSLFKTDVMSGMPVREIPGFVEYRIEDIVIDLSE